MRSSCSSTRSSGQCRARAAAPPRQPVVAVRSSESRRHHLLQLAGVGASVLLPQWTLRPARADEGEAGEIHLARSASGAEDAKHRRSVLLNGHRSSCCIDQGQARGVSLSRSPRGIAPGRASCWAGDRLASPADAGSPGGHGACASPGCLLRVGCVCVLHQQNGPPPASCTKDQ